MNMFIELYLINIMSLSIFAKGKRYNQFFTDFDMPCKWFYNSYAISDIQYGHVTIYLIFSDIGNILL